MSSSADHSSESDDDGYYGPSLPPVTQPAQRASLIGPVLPQQWKNDDDDEDSATIGPLPPGATGPDPHANHQPVIRRSQNDDQPKREEWMTVVPEKVEKRLGFKSVTSFSQKPIGPSVSVSTKEKTASDHAISETDLEAVAERKRAASLLDSHQKQKKAKSEVKPETEERQPFDPEKDLQVRKLDSRQTQSIISNSKLLNTRFNSGPSKFL